MPCSRTGQSDAGEAPTPGIESCTLLLSHCAPDFYNKLRVEKSDIENLNVLF